MLWAVRQDIPRLAGYSRFGIQPSYQAFTAPEFDGVIFERFSGFARRLIVVVTDQRYRPDDVSILSNGVRPIFGHLNCLRSHPSGSNKSNDGGQDYPGSQIGNKWQFAELSTCRKQEETNMPVLLLWAVPAVIVIGGAGYWLVHLH